MHQELFERWLAGDEGALQELYEHFRPRIARFASVLVDSESDGDDLAQETFLRLHRARDRLLRDGIGNGRALLYTIARRLAFNHVAYRQRWNTLYEDSAEALASLAAGSTDPEALYQSAELRGAVRAGIDGLPGPQRELIILRYLEDLGYQEIAEVVGCRVDHVRTRLQYARRLLRPRLEQMGLLPE